MTALLLLAIAMASPASTGARVQGVATAYIVAGERIALNDSGFDRMRKLPENRQISRLRRVDRDSGQSELRLLEFQ